MNRRSIPGLTARLKEKLIRQGLERRLRHPTSVQPSSARSKSEDETVEIPEQHTRFDLHPGYQRLRIMVDGAARLGIGNPFFKVHEATAGGRTRIAQREYLNFSSYNYL